MGRLILLPCAPTWRKPKNSGSKVPGTGEQVLGTLPLLSPLEVLSYAAAYTRWIRLGCAMLVSPLHNPVHLAKTIASVDQLSRGRLDVGLVTGGPFRTFSAFEVDPASYLDRFSQGLELMRQLWTSPRIDFDGQFWQLLNAAMEPKPFQKPYPPIWFGGSHPNALRRAVPLAHGFIGAGTSTTAQFAEHARNVRQELHRQHRDPKTSSLPWSAGDGPKISVFPRPSHRIWRSSSDQPAEDVLSRHKRARSTSRPWSAQPVVRRRVTPPQCPRQIG